jgi:hypothetical protein
MKTMKIGFNKSRIILLLLITGIVFSPSYSSAFQHNISGIDTTELTDNDKIDYRAVLVGIGQIQNLPYSVRQILGFKTTLMNGGRWKESNIKILLDEQATKEAISSEIAWLANNSDDNDVSLFYFVGHGSRVSTNAFIHASDSVIVDEELSIYFQNISGSLVVILDSCYSGGLIDELAEENRTILTACAEDETTYQVHDLNAGMFGYFVNLSLAWCTKNIESTFLVTKMLTHYYGNKISEEYDKDYRITPQFSDNDPGFTWLLYKHAYAKQIFKLMRNMIDSDGYNRFWEMNEMSSPFNYREVFDAAS